MIVEDGSICHPARRHSLRQRQTPKGARMNRRPAIASVLASALALAACGQKPASDTAASGADLIISGGPIVTMEGDQPTTVEAIVVDDGRIVFVGSKADALKQQGAGTVLKDLAGKTLMPGFIDGHAHAQQFGTQAVGANLLAPPDGTVSTIDDVVAKLKTFAEGPDVKRTGWIFGMGYDDALLGRHPTREDLDKVSTTVPVMATHISGHFAAVNTLGLKMIGYDASTPNPEGGVIRREADGKTPNGVLEELAAIPNMLKALGPTTQEGKDYFLKRGLELAKSYGYTTANEGRMFGPMHAVMEDAAKRGLLDIDFTGWMDYTGRAELDKGFSASYTNHYRLAGLKITLDGSPQGRTAWRTVPYLIPPDGQKPGYKGYPAIPDTKQVEAYLDEAYAKGWPVKVHVNGDAAIDQLFEALKPVVAKHGVKPGQVILVHGQFIRPDQVQQLKSLGIFPSMFPMHTFYWGDWYMKIVGPEQANRISPMRSILNTGLHATSHTDAPVALPNLMQVVWATVNRTSRSGTIIGPDERVSPYEAMKMITLWSAEQFGEQATKGSIEKGKLADLVVLSDNPITVDPATINQIQVLETIKDGKTVWARK
jgi:predicted amidohydrolase YtcJ